MVSEFLTPEIRAMIARVLGLDNSVAGKAISAAIPGILGGLMGSASTPEGADKLFDAVTSQGVGSAQGMASSLGAGGESLISKGTSALTSLLGGSAVSTIAGAIGKFAGIGSGAGSSLVGLLAPVVMGALGKVSAQSGLDASGLSSLLASQKANISAALPAGVGDMLKSAGIPGFSQVASGATATAGSAMRAAQSSMAHAASYVPPPPRAPGMPAWALWAIPIVALAALALWLLGRNTEPVQQAAVESGQAATTAMKSDAEPAVQAAVGAVDVKSALQTAFGTVKTTLEGITDSASAQAALPVIKDATTKLGDLGSTIAKLPAAERSPLAALVSTVRPSIDELTKKVLAVPGVDTVAKPAIDQLNAKLDDLAKV
jgi:hypothetical protein